MADDIKNRPFAALKNLQAKSRERAREVAREAMSNKAEEQAKARAVEEARLAEAAAKSKAAAKEKTVPYEDYGYEDRVSFQQAFSGVKPLHQTERKAAKRAIKRPPSTPPKPIDREARAQLDALVSGAVKFTCSGSGEDFLAYRNKSVRKTAQTLAEGRLPPEARLDLHGLSGDQAEESIRNFVRQNHHQGRLTLLIVHGKGKGSAGGESILTSVTHQTLMRGVCAPIVEALAAAPPRFGGHGATFVRLKRKGGKR